jgi:S-adenosylmethionine/arginine decarboxylase-like enzyme
MSIHKHVLIRAEVTKPIVDRDVAINWMRRLVNEIGMKITRHGGPHCDYVRKEGNEGITVAALIETSHCAMHVWDKKDPPLVQLDVYSCAEFQVRDVLELVYEMEPSKISFKLFDRSEDIVETTSIPKLKQEHDWLKENKEP